MPISFYVRRTPTPPAPPASYVDYEISASDIDADLINYTARLHVDPSDDLMTLVESNRERTGVDDSGTLTVSGTRATFTNSPRNANMYCYEDAGTSDENNEASTIGNVRHNFEVDFDVVITGTGTGTGKIGCLSLTNNLGTMADHDTNNDGLAVSVEATDGGNVTFKLHDNTNNNITSSSAYTGESYPFTRYCRLNRRDDNVYLYIFTDSARTNLEKTVTDTSASETGYRYVSYALSMDDGDTTTISGYIDNVSGPIGWNYLNATVDQSIVDLPLQFYQSTSAINRINMGDDWELNFGLQRNFSEHWVMDLKERAVGDFVLEWEQQITLFQSSATFVPIYMYNDYDASETLPTNYDSDDDYLFIQMYNNFGSWRWGIGSTGKDIDYDFYTNSSVMYCRFERIDSTATLTLFTDAARTTQVYQFERTGLTTASLRYIRVGTWDDAANANDVDGYCKDHVFTSATAATESFCAMEVAQWSAHRGGELYVQIPKVSSSTNTTIRIDTDTTTPATDNRWGTGWTRSGGGIHAWDWFYNHVLHYKDPTDYLYKLSSFQSTSGFTGIGTSAPDDYIDGVNGRARTFNGSQAMISPDSSYAQYTPMRGVTMEVLCRIDSTASDSDCYIFGKENEIKIVGNAGGGTGIEGNYYLSSAWRADISAWSANSNQWYHIASTYLESSEEQIDYVDGVQRATYTHTGLGNLPDTSNGLSNGRNSNTATNWFNGAIQEVRMSRVVRSAAWIKANNKSDRGTLLTVVV